MPRHLVIVGVAAALVAVALAVTAVVYYLRRE